MNIQLGKYAGPQNKIIKSFEDLTSYQDAVFKRSEDMQRPDIWLTGNLSDFQSFNYVIIGDGVGATYHVTSWESYRNTIVIAHCELDVLTSYRAAILDSYALIDRAESTYNLYLQDPYIDVLGYMSPDTKNPGTDLINNENIIAIIVGE